MTDSAGLLEEQKIVQAEFSKPDNIKLYTFTVGKEPQSSRKKTDERKEYTRGIKKK